MIEPKKEREDSPEKRAQADEQGATIEVRFESVIRALGQGGGRVSQVTLRDTEDDHSPALRIRATQTASIPARIGRYEVTGEIARGGVGSVWKAHDVDLGRDIALKVLLDEHDGDADMTRRFVEEAQIGGQLQHPGVVPVHEMGLIGGTKPFFAMKLVKGRTLATLLDKRQDPAEDRQRFVGIFEQICQPLAYAHARDVIHRDLKPSNVMVGAFGEVQVMDWGLAKVLARGGIADDRRVKPSTPQASVIETVRSATSASASLAGSVLGTPAYMSPEQARGDVDDLDERSDVFGLGAILCQILTGAPPYTTDSSEDALRQAKKGYLDDALSRLESCGADPELTDLAKRCLALRPSERPRDAGAVAEEVSSYLQSLEKRARASEMEAVEAQIKVREERKARRLTVALAATVVLALLLGGGGYVWVDRERRESATAAVLGFERALTRARTLADQASAAGDRRVELWIKAREAIQRVRSLLTPAVKPDAGAEVEALDERINQELKSRRVLAQLEEVRDQVVYSGIDEGYGKAFREILGAEIFEFSEDEAAARLSTSGIATDLALALDDWALVRKQLRRSFDGLAAISQKVEATRWRVLLWEAVRIGTPEGIERFVASLGDSESAAAVLCILARPLGEEGRFDAAEALLRRAVRLEPRSYRANYLLGRLLSEERVGRLAESLPYLMTARALRPRSMGVLAALAGVQYAMGDLDDAIFTGTRLLAGPSYMFFLALEPLFDADHLDVSTDALDALRDAIVVTAAERPDPGLWEVLGVTLASRYGPGEEDKALELPLREVERTGRKDAAVLNMLARVQFGVGRRADAIRTLEEALTHPGTPGRWEEQLKRYCQAVLPDLVSYASVDAAVDTGEGLLAGEDEKRMQPFREALRERNAHALSAYLEGRLLARGGDHGAAARKFRDVLALDRNRREPFLRLRESLRKSLGSEAADRLFREEIEKGAPVALLQLPAQKPRDLVARTEGPGVRLETAPFEQLDPRVSHVASRWQIRREAGDYELDPVFDVLSRKALTAISVPAYRLRPETTYHWTATHLRSTGEVVRSDESTFRSPSYTLETVPFDLREHFNVDVIANPGDDLNGTIDGGFATLVVTGYDGTSSPNPRVRGLPPERRLGDYRLGDYDHDNAIQLVETEGSPIRIEVPRRRYVAIRFLVTCGFGKAAVPIRLVYADGSFELRTLVGDDWGNHVTATGSRRVEEGNVPILGGLFRLLHGRFDSPRWALFDVCLEVDPDRELEAFVLEADQMRGETQATEGTRFNLFAATGVWVGATTGG